MTQNSSPWDGISVGDAANSPYSAAEWSHLWALLGGAGSGFPNYGILQGTGGSSTFDPLQVSAAGGANVQVNIGAALVNGKLYETDAAVPLTVGANVSGNPRIDTVVLRADYIAQTVRPVIVQGTPAGSPVPPTLTQTASVWEMPLANIAAANGFATIAATDITDRRRAARHSAAGWQSHVYPIGYVANSADSGTIAMNGLAVPIMLTGNMLVESVSFMATATGNQSLKWGIYTQDLNDGDTANEVLRCLGGKLSTDLVVVSNGAVVNVPADASPVFVPPGSYWLIVGGMTSFRYVLPTIAALDVATNKALINTTSNPVAQTVDMGTGFAKDVNNYPVRVNGRVFGETVLF